MEIRELAQGIIYIKDLNKLVYDNNFIINSGFSLDELKEKINEYYEYISEDEKDILYAKANNIKIFTEKPNEFNFELIKEYDLDFEINQLKEKFSQYSKEIDDEYNYIKQSDHNLLLLNIAFYLKDMFERKNIKRFMMRGSGISSFILYLIGLNKVNPLKFNLDFKNFWKI